MFSRLHLGRQRCTCDLLLGKGALLAKFDFENAYPVHPQDRLLLGMTWEGSTYVDGALPFGLRSAPKLFTAIANALPRRFFLVLGPLSSEDCGRSLATSLELCRSLGVPVAAHKTEGPCTSL